MTIMVKHQRQLGLFSPAGTLELVAIDILGSLTVTKEGNMLVVTIMDSYSKLKKAIPTAKSHQCRSRTFFGLTNSIWYPRHYSAGKW